LHVVRCGDKGCTCRQYRADQTAEFLLRTGVRAGNWQFITVDQLKFLMRPDQPEIVRVWACGMLHINGPRRKDRRHPRLAMMINARGELVPLTPAKIVSELNEMDPLGRMSKQNVRRTLLNLERTGAARIAGKKSRGNRLLFFYNRPLPSRHIATEPQILEAEQRAQEVKSDYFSSASNSNKNDLPETNFSNLRGVVVKAFKQAVRDAVLSLSELFGIKPSTLFGILFEYGPTCRSSGRRPKACTRPVSVPPASP
jgi:hypothetical protein